jgi:hypothetical protein
MAEGSPANRSASTRKGALNERANPSEPMVESDQFLLGSADARCLEAASLMCGAVHQASRDNGFTLSTVASLAGKDLSGASRAFDGQDPHTVLRYVAAVILLDKSRTFLRLVNRLAGCELVERPKLTPEQKVERLEAYLRRRGKVGELEIAEAYGEDER